MKRARAWLRVGWIAGFSIAEFGWGGVCWGIVGSFETEQVDYELLADQDPFIGLVKISAGCACGVTTGSGFLLNDNWVVSAAHVIDGKDFSTLSVQWNGVQRAVNRVETPAEWKDHSSTGLDQGGDLVLLHLDASYSFGRVTPIATGPLDDRFSVMLGSGKGGNGILGSYDTAKVRAASNTIDRQLQTSLGGGLLVTDFDSGNVPQNSLNATTVSRRYYDDGFTTLRPSDLLLEGGDVDSLLDRSMNRTLLEQFSGLRDVSYEGTTASGDSGGPLMVFDEAKAEWQLAGVTSWGFNPTLGDDFTRYDSRYGDVAFFTDLSQHEAWMTEIVPEPSVSLLFSIGGLVMLIWRFRRCDSNSQEL